MRFSERKIKRRDCKKTNLSLSLTQLKLIFTLDFSLTLESGGQGQGINVGPGKFVKKN